MDPTFTERIFKIIGRTDFNACCLELLDVQVQDNPLFSDFISRLKDQRSKEEPASPELFLPISFFRTHEVRTSVFSEEAVFASSGTTGSRTSRHFVRSLELYRRSFVEGFRHFYGEPASWCILALLPGYLERPDSSLVYMVQELCRLSGHPSSGFFLDDLDKLKRCLIENERVGQKTLLIGVTFALMDFAESHSLDLKHTVVMETGGMKGRREELTREEVHQFLSERFGVSAIHSEYGMTELLSQAYSAGGGIFRCPPWMSIQIREVGDPLTLCPPGKTGGINVIDLANAFSCGFIATQDLGRMHGDGSFEVLGRFDHSDARGCNLLID